MVAGCPSKPGLSTAEFSTDFRKGADAAKDFKTTTGSINYIADGAEYSITKLGEGPTIQSNFYIQFGYVEVVMKAAPGAGIVSSFVMQSDALDEIDWEWIGSDNAKAQSELLLPVSLDQNPNRYKATISEKETQLHMTVANFILQLQ